MKEGYIKLFRQSLDSAVFGNANLWQVWCYCLLRANHEESKILWNGKEVTLKPGQFLSGRFSGAKECHMKPSTFRNQIALLKRLKNLDISSDSGSSLITVIKWEEFQGNGTVPRKPRTGERTPEGQPKDTDKNERMKERELYIRTQDFRDELLLYDKDYSSELLREFFEYWSEPDRSGKKMRRELEKTWDTSRRLRTWKRNKARFQNNQYTGKESARDPLPEIKLDTPPWMNG